MKTSKIKILLILIVTVLMSAVPVLVYSSSTADAISAMESMNSSDVTDESGVFGPILNSVIGIIQVAGTGISMVMVTILGIRYIMASPSDKADVKKQIAPLVIGAIILFASVNLVALVADVANETLSGAAGG